MGKPQGDRTFSRYWQKSPGGGSMKIGYLIGYLVFCTLTDDFLLYFTLQTKKRGWLWSSGRLACSSFWSWQPSSAPSLRSIVPTPRTRAIARRPCMPIVVLRGVVTAPERCVSSLVAEICLVSTALTKEGGWKLTAARPQPGVRSCLQPSGRALISSTDLVRAIAWKSPSGFVWVLLFPLVDRVDVACFQLMFNTKLQRKLIVEGLPKILLVYPVPDVDGYL